MVDNILMQIYADGLFGVPIATPNSLFDPAKLTMWAKWQLIPTTTRNGSFCSIEELGILQITLFVPIGTGSAAIEAKADQIKAHFGTGKMHKVGAYQVLVNNSHKAPAMPDESKNAKWYMQPVSISYEVIQ